MLGESLSLDKATNPRRIEAKSSLVNAGVMTGVVTFLRTLDEPRFMLPSHFPFLPPFCMFRDPQSRPAGVLQFIVPVLSLTERRAGK